MKASDNQFPKLLFTEGAAPAAPAAGQVVAYAKADGLLYAKDDAGTETPLGGAISSSTVTIIIEAAAFTADPATHAGIHNWILAADDVTFDSAQTYTAGEVYPITATAALTLIGTGVTLTPPAGGTLALDADMSVEVRMTSPTTARLIGQTVPA